MKTRKFHQYNKQFHIGYLLSPRVGGPFQTISHLIPYGVSEKEYWKGVAKEIEYIAFRPDFTSINLDETSSWEYDQQTKQFLKQCRVKPIHNTISCLAPQFSNDGHIYELIGAELSRVDRQTWNYSNWSAVNTATSTRTLLEMIEGFLKTGKMKYALQWKLLYILKISWKATDPKRRSYEIFVPPFEWIKAHAFFQR